MFLSRLRWKKKSIDQQIEYSYDELRLNPVVNVIFDLIMRLDELLIRLGMSLPCGGSMIVVAKK